MKGGEEILHIDNICKNFDLGRGKVLKACDCVDIIVHKAETNTLNPILCRVS